MGMSFLVSFFLKRTPRSQSNCLHLEQLGGYEREANRTLHGAKFENYLVSCSLPQAFGVWEHWPNEVVRDPIRCWCCCCQNKHTKALGTGTTTTRRYLDYKHSECWKSVSCKTKNSHSSHNDPKATAVGRCCRSGIRILVSPQRGVRVE